MEDNLVGPFSPVAILNRISAVAEAAKDFVDENVDILSVDYFQRTSKAQLSFS